jgi:GNAT superfamily N-acetyltransferase
LNVPDDWFRTELKPGDIGAIVQMHGLIYAKEYGFDHTFEAYVAGPLAECVRAASPRDRIWIAERDDKIVGCIAIVAASSQVAQLRWFLVDPAYRGLGLGSLLLVQALMFCEEMSYDSIFLWTVSALTSAARLYQSAGFKKVEENPGHRWGVDVIEEKYELLLK